MRFLARSTLIIFIAAFSHTFGSSLNAQSKPGITAATGNVTGTVIVQGRPASGVVVGLRDSPYSGIFSGILRTKTDQDGVYRIMNVPPGTYEVWAPLPAYVLSGESTRAITVVVSPGEKVNGIDLSFIRGGAITGRVTDADGRPVIEQRMMLIDADPSANQREFYRSTNTATDDRGIYRMFGIRPGRYKVAVGLDDNPFGGMRGPAYRRTYHPDVSDSAKATVVEVNEGSESSNINITVGRPIATFAISGRVIDGETGKPLPNIQFGIRLIGPRSSYGIVGGAGLSNSRGEFRFEGLTPGKYGIFMATSETDSNVRADPVMVEIVDQDVAGVVINTATAGTMVGTIALDDPQNKVARAKLANLELHFHVTNQNNSYGNSRTATINADGTFRVNGLDAGIVHVSLSGRDGEQEKGFAIAQLLRDGIAQPNGIEIKPGEDIRNVEIVVSYGTGSVRGTVKLTKGTVTPGMRFWVQITKLGGFNERLPPPEVDMRGQFFIDGLVGGTYKFTIYMMRDSPGPFQVRVSQQVEVVNGITNAITFTIDPDAAPVEKP